MMTLEHKQDALFAAYIAHHPHVTAEQACQWIDTHLGLDETARRALIQRSLAGVMQRILPDVLTQRALYRRYMQEHAHVFQLDSYIAWLEAQQV